MSRRKMPEVSPLRWIATTELPTTPATSYLVIDPEVYFKILMVGLLESLAT